MTGLKPITYQEWVKFRKKEMARILDYNMSLDIPNAEPISPDTFWLDEPFARPEDFGFYIDYRHSDIPF